MTEETKGRLGVLADPITRLDDSQVRDVHATSVKILEEIGVICYNREASRLLSDAGCTVRKSDDQACEVRMPRGLVEELVAKAPSTVLLGARDPSNVLVLDADEPRVRFGSGSEANVFLEMETAGFSRAGVPGETTYPVYSRLEGSVELLCDAARLCQQLENLDFFIRTVNIQDHDIGEPDKDVNKFFACLNNIDKHVMAGLTEIESLDAVIEMGEIIAGGAEELRVNPVFSFITCITKSPLQFIDDTTAKMMEIVKKGIPVAISSSPQGGSTAPIQEAGIVSQINAEIIAGVALSQLVRPGAPVLYGSVPVRARMDDLQDLYGAPEFCNYNVDCIQMARFYGIPSYSTAGVADASVPGVQATVEKMLSHAVIPMAGAQYVHYSFGLLEKTNVFSPDQAVLDDAQIGIVKHMLRAPKVRRQDFQEAFLQVQSVMGTGHKLFARYARKGTRDGAISPPYAFEAVEEADLAVMNAHRRRMELMERPPHHLDREVVEEIYRRIPGLVDRINPYA